MAVRTTQDDLTRAQAAVNVALDGSTRPDRGGIAEQADAAAREAFYAWVPEADESVALWFDEETSQHCLSPRAQCAVRVGIDKAAALTREQWRTAFVAYATWEEEGGSNDEDLERGKDLWNELLRLSALADGDPE